MVPLALLIALLTVQVSSTRPAHEIDVTFQSGGVTLAGTLFVPDGPGPWPAMVLAHGSGPERRTAFRPFADRFVRLGIATLAFDKRGCGESGGSWLNASLDDLAGTGFSAHRGHTKDHQDTGCGND